MVVESLRRVYTSDFVFDEREVNHVLEVLRSGWISQGGEVAAFEDEFAEWYDVKHAVTANSGSSANLVALSVLTNKNLGERRIKVGDEVITSPVTFPTSCFPIVQVGAVPVFVDVDPETYCINPYLVEKAVTTRTKAIVPIHLMGHPCDMKGIMEIAEEHALFVVEDCCEAHGAECYGRKVGTFGDFGAFSFFVAHHITTGEGGMLITNNDSYADLARSIRSFGRVIEVASAPSIQKTHRYKTVGEKLGSYDVRQTFVNLGYSLKMTDLQAAIGREQLKRLGDFIRKRQENAEYLIKRLKSYSDLLQLPIERPWAKHVYHHVPIIVKPRAPFTRLQIVEHLEEHGVETRPIEAGNLVDQPCMEDVNYRVFGSLPIAEHVKDNGFFIGCHPGLTREDLDYVVDVFTMFLEGGR